MIIVWITGGILLAMFTVTIVRGIRLGKAEGARLEGAFRDLEDMKCPACSRPYGPSDPQSPYYRFMPDPDFPTVRGANFWRIRCPHCGHEAVVGLRAEAKTLGFFPPAE